MLKKRLLLPVLAAGFLTACAGPVEDTLPGQPIKHRQEAFKEILRSFEPMGTMLRTQRYEADAFSAMATQLHQFLDAPWAYFVEGSDVPPSRAKPEVWGDAEAFDRARAEFHAATKGLLASASTRDETEIRSAYARVEQSCRSCHDGFRR